MVNELLNKYDFLMLFGSLVSLPSIFSGRRRKRGGKEELAASSSVSMLSVFNMIEAQVATRPALVSQGFKMLVLHLNLSVATSCTLSPVLHRRNVVFRIHSTPFPEHQRDNSTYIKTEHKSILSGLTF